jgi:hypothetical protein
MVQVWIAAFLREKSAIKKFMMAKPYRQQTARIQKMLEMLSFMTKHFVTPEDQN